MALVTNTRSEVETPGGVVRLVVTYDDATLAVGSLAVEAKGDAGTTCTVRAGTAEARTVRGEDVELDKTGLSMRRVATRGKDWIVPDFTLSFETVRIRASSIERV